MYSSSREFREYLLARTLLYASHEVPYYKHLKKAENETPLTLQDFPILRKEQVSADLTQFLVLDHFPDYVITSGGTTGGSPNVSFRNEEEYQAVHQCFSGVGPAQRLDPDSIQECSLDIFFNSNGYYWRKPSGWPILNMTLEQRSHAEFIRNLLQNGVPLKGRSVPVRHVLAQNGPLKVLTGYFVVNDFLPRDCGLHQLFSYGGHVSNIWMERFHSIWGLDVTTSYGLSEFSPGNAMQCSHCGSYHYWTAWPEFLALDHGGAVDEGDAALVLTNLIPFAQAQPRVRYLTEDIVTVTGYCEKADQLGFRFRGRASSSVVVRDGSQKKVLLSEVEVLEVAERLRDVNCRIHSAEYQIWSDPNLRAPPFAMGFPRFRLSSNCIGDFLKEVSIAIEVSFDPSVHPSRAKRFQEEFRSTFLSEFPDIANQLDLVGASLVIEVLSPGALNLRIKGSA
jgi:hypothetical protein